MSVVIETTVGDITVDLFLEERPKACLNFLKLCKLKYYNYNLFHTIENGFIAQTGDPTGSGDGGESIWGVLEGTSKRFFQAEYQPKIRHSDPGLLSMVSLGDNLIGSQFFITLGNDLTSLDGQHCVIGQVTEGLDILRHLNDAICDNTHRPYQDIRITHTVILDDPYENPRGFRAPSRSPSPNAERLQGGRIGADEDIDDKEGKTEQEIQEMLQEREAKARATILEIVGDLPDAEVAPPENVLFVCKLNPVTSDDDLEIIFSRFGKVKGCEVIRDRTTGDSLQYAFVEFEDCKACENAYFKMDNVLIDDRRIHVDFSQSVAKVQWKGKGRGLVWKDGNKTNRLNFNDLKGQNQPERGIYDKNRRDRSPQRTKRSPNRRERSPHRQDRLPIRQPLHHGSPRRQRRSRSPYSNKELKRIDDRQENYHGNKRGRRLESRSRSRDKKEDTRRLSPQGRSHEKSDRVKRLASRSKSRDSNHRTKRRTSRSKSRDRNYRRLTSRSRSRGRSNRFDSQFGRSMQYDDRRGNQSRNVRRKSPNNQRRGSESLRSSEVSRPRISASPIQKTKSSTVNKKPRRSVSLTSSDSDSSPVRKKSKKSKNKRKSKKTKKSKKSKKSRKVSSTESSSSDSSSSS